jgi:integrase
VARPKTTLNTAGSIRLSAQVRDSQGHWVAAPSGTKAERWKARTRHRDSDGVLREVTRFASTKSRAESVLKAALVERSAPSRHTVIRPDMPLKDAATVWLEKVDRSDSKLSDSTRKQYRDAYRRYVDGSSIIGLTLRELNSVPVLESWLQETADSRGTGAAKTARSVVSSVIALAVRYRALPYNAMRDVRPAKASAAKTNERDSTRALSRAERQHVLEVADLHGGACAADVTDIVYFLAGTGVRISEALGQLWKDVDLEAGTVLVRGTKTIHSQRLLTLPEWLLQRLKRRAATKRTAGLLFPSPGTADPSKQRDRRNVARVIRQVLDEAGFPWATAHTFRRTVATLLDEAGLPIALAANQLGHSDPAMTARVYLGRKGSTAAAAAVL